jgi:hypothetical protein
MAHAVSLLWLWLRERGRLSHAYTRIDHLRASAVGLALVVTQMACGG